MNAPIENSDQRATATDLLYTVFAAERVPGGVRFTEQCDQHYTETLTRDQVAELCAELMALADSPEPMPAPARPVLPEERRCRPGDYYLRLGAVFQVAAVDLPLTGAATMTATCVALVPVDDKGTSTRWIKVGERVRVDHADHERLTPGRVSDLWQMAAGTGVV